MAIKNGLGSKGNFFALTLAVVMASAGAVTGAPVSATWTGGSGTWSTGSHWSTSPNYPVNGTPANTYYNINILTGSVSLTASVNVDSVTLGTGNDQLNIGTGATLNLAQGDQSGAPGVLSASGSSVIFLVGGTIANATFFSSSPSPVGSPGVIYIPSPSLSGTVQNVTLGSDFSIEGNGTQLNVINSATVAQGINLNTHTLTVTSAAVNFQDVTSGGNDVGEVVDNGTLYLQSSPVTVSASLTIGTAGKVVLTAASGIGGQSLTNNGHVDVGGTNTGGPAYISTATFTNTASGIITVYSGSSLNIDSGNFINYGLIQTSAAAHLTSGTTGGATIAFNGTWTNNGTINIATNDFIFYGSSASAGGTGTTSANGGQVVGLSNPGNINVGSATVTGVAASFIAPNFSNSGTVTVFNGNGLVIGQSPSSANPLVTNFSNAGTIITANALGAGLTTGASITLAGNWSNSNLIQVGNHDTLTLNGAWSNSGTIEGVAGATINLNGTFNSSDVGLASGGSSGTFSPNGATVNFNGTLINTGNNLEFGPNSGVWTANESFLQQPAIRGGVLSVLDQPNGTAYLQGDFIILENVTLGSDYNVRNFQIAVASAVNGQPGLVSNGHAINVFDKNGFVNFDSNNVFPVNSDSFDGTINLYGQASGISTTVTFTLTSSAVINALATAAGQPNSMTASVNNGNINAGSSTVSGAVLNIEVGDNPGAIRAYNGNIAAIYCAQKWEQDGILEALAGGTIDVIPGGSSGRALELAHSSILDVQLGAAGTTGLLSVTGDLQIDSGATLSLAQLDGTAFSGPYDIVNYTGVLTGQFSDVTSGYVLDYSHSGEILVTAVPEAASLAFLGVGVMGVFVRRRRA